MPNFTPYTKRQLDVALDKVGSQIYTVVGQLNIRGWCTKEPVPFTNRHQGQERPFEIGDKWGDLFDCAWFNFTGTIPDEAAGKKIVLLLDVNGEMCVVNEFGVPVRGLTTVSSTFDLSLGRPGKRELSVTDLAHGGEKIDVWADAGCNDLFGNVQGNGTIREAAIAICDDEMKALYYDIEVLIDFLHVLSQDTARYQQILVALTDAVHVLRDGSSVQVRDARALLAPMLAKRGGDPSLQISAIGHAHMDLAWLWPIRETIRKGARTFATVLDLMQKYPDYVFGASQPRYFLWMKEHYPLLYAKIKRRVKEGRIEPQGAMWVEADTNISGGEALVRQILYGKQFFRDEFGVDVNDLWLPDVFGYTASLPQILAKSGVDYFMTQKLSWSLINAFPHQSFHWQGIDGTTVLTHMLPEETYNGPAAPRSIAKIEKNYHDKGVSNHALMVFGIGDGGGGPGEEHLERLMRIKNMAGLCPVTQERVGSFWKKWAMEADRFPAWVGELYLERHQGTLTTEAQVKWYNRKLEFALRELEWTSVLAALLAGTTYPSLRLEAIWREMLLYQFHDILPGSSIKRVYDECVPRYREMLQKAAVSISGNDEQVARTIDTSDMEKPFIVYNSLSWTREEWLQVGSKWVRSTVPSMGYKVVDAAAQVSVPKIKATKTLLENDVLCVRFNQDGAIRSILDKRVNRQVLAQDDDGNVIVGNRLAVYKDLGDAWDFAMDYAEFEPHYMKLVSTKAGVNGPRAVLTQIYQLGRSRVIQRISLVADSPRLDFETQVEWYEPNAMLRTSFPVNVTAQEATYDIQFGHIRRPTHRNTTWDLARDEVPAHKWVDLSQRDYGVALLNDSKYGHKVKGNVIDLNLLRSVPYPGPRLVADRDVPPGGPDHNYTDQGEHFFTYALYPHIGDHVDGRVAQAGYELNVPLRMAAAKPQQGLAPSEASFLEVSADTVIVEAVKKAETGNDIIVRLYECEQRSTQATVHFHLPFSVVYETNLIEENVGLLPLRDGAVTLTFKPFEIKTLRMVIK